MEWAEWPVAVARDVLTVARDVLADMVDVAAFVLVDVVALVVFVLPHADSEASVMRCLDHN